MSDLSDDMMRDLLNTFQVEAAEHIETLNQALLKLERTDNDAARRELVQTAFRTAHSLKGAARAVELPTIERLAHDVEDVLQKARDTDTTPDGKIFDVLYHMLDGIQALIAGQPVDADGLRARLAAVVGAEMPVDIAPLPEIVTPDEPVSGGDMDDVVIAGSETIRVAVSKLDELMAQSSELLISKINAEQRLNELQELRQQMARFPRAWREIRALLRHIDGDTGQRLKSLLTQHYDTLQTLSRTFAMFEQALSTDTLRLGMVTGDLQEDVRRTRMLPFQTMALSMERTIRDAARTENKRIDFTIEGREVELDKKVLEALKDPLAHLLRNAVSHGVETPEAREAAGKSAAGSVRLEIRQRGSEVSLTVSDDGRGFDLDALRKSGGTEQTGSTPEDAISLAFLPGVTTAQHVTAISGRGVGLDVVRGRIEELHGRLNVENTPGFGAAIELIVPSSVTMMRGLIVRAGQEQFVLPLLSVERIIDAGATFAMGGRQMLRLGQTSLPLVPLAAVLERPVTTNKSATNLVVIITVAEQRLALLVDDVQSELELAVKPLGDPLQRVRNVAGAALLGNGDPIIILNPGDLIRSARGAVVPEHIADKTPAAEHVSGGHILVVDDSITTRTLEKNILEAAGFRVTIAFDGLEALKRLRENEIDLVVSDVQMPNMDGFTLTRSIRDIPEYKYLPVILVTSLESQSDREQGMLAGADAYIVKRGFNQAALLTTIKQFLERVL